MVAMVTGSSHTGVVVGDLLLPGSVPGAAVACDMSAWRMSSDQLYALLVGTP